MVATMSPIHVLFCNMTFSSLIQGAECTSSSLKSELACDALWSMHCGWTSVLRNLVESTSSF
jgi:hypothetical protein